MWVRKVLCPEVWRALSFWYGAPVVVERRVVRAGGGGDLRRLWMKNQAGDESGLILELYPLCLRIATCGPDGKVGHEGVGFFPFF